MILRMLFSLKTHNPNNFLYNKWQHKKLNINWPNLSFTITISAKIVQGILVLKEEDKRKTGICKLIGSEKRMRRLKSSLQSIYWGPFASSIVLCPDFGLFGQCPC